jgi:hypothetical protein
LNSKPATAATAARPPDLAASSMHDGEVLSNWFRKKETAAACENHACHSAQNISRLRCCAGGTAKIVSIHIDTRQ